MVKLDEETVFTQLSDLFFEGAITLFVIVNYSHDKN